MESGTATRIQPSLLAPGSSWVRGHRSLIALVIGLAACFAALLSDTQALQSVLLGLGGGSLIASLALGLVVTYRGSGVVNIATGAVAMYASYVFNSLDSKGDLLLLGWKVHLGAPWGFMPSALATLVIMAGWSFVFYRLIFGPLATASPIAKVVASVGLLLTLQAIILLCFSTEPFGVTTHLSNASIHLPSSLVLPVNLVVLTGAVILIALVLWAVYRFTLFGIATRAAAQDDQALSLVGRSPRFVSGGNWMFSGVVVTLFAILIAPINGTVDPTTDVLLVVPALAAALIGRFSSFGMAALGGLMIGMLQGLLQYLSTKGWFPTSNGQPLPGVSEAVPFIIILVVLLFRRGGIGSRGSIGTVRLPFAPAPRLVMPKVAICFTLGLIGFLTLGSTWRLAELNTLVGIAICLSLVILTGFAGQASLAQMAFAGLSGFLLSKLAEGAGIAFPFAPLLAALGAAGLGILIAFPALRIRGVQLAVMTLAFGVAVQAMVFNNPVLDGTVDPASVPSPELFGFKFGPIDPTSFGPGGIPNAWFGIFCLIVVTGAAWFTCSIRSSGWGRRMLAVRANERAAAAAGISVEYTKIVAFGIAAFVAGIGGALSAYRFGSVTPEYFGVMTSLSFLAFAYMGGISSVTGAVIGGLLATNGLMFAVLQEWLGVSPEYALLVGGLGLLLTVVLNPEGIAGATRLMLLKSKFGRRLAGVPEPVTIDDLADDPLPPLRTVQGEAS
jgi:branched-chain amino acid transport system permease protein